VYALTGITLSALLIQQTVWFYSTLKGKNLVELRRGSCDSRRETGSDSFLQLRQ
jgi:hypothetical protein